MSQSSVINDAAHVYLNKLRMYGESDSRTKDSLEKLCTIIYPATCGIAKSIIKSYKARTSDDVLDLIAEGMLAVVDKTRSYDDSGIRTASYNTYIFSHIAGAMRHYMRDKFQIVRKPAKVQENAYKLRDASVDMANENEMADLCKKYGISHTALLAALEAPHKFITECTLVAQYRDMSNMGADDILSEVHISLALAKLPLELQEILTLMSDGFNESDIADILDIAKPAAKLKVIEARAALHEEISRED